MADDGPGDAGILQLRDADLAREGAVRLVEDVLRRDLDAGAELRPARKQVEGWGRDDDFCFVWGGGGSQSVR